MIASLLGWLGLGWVRWLIGVAVVVAIAGTGAKLEHWRMAGQVEQQRAETARVRAEHAQAVANAASAALAQSEANRRAEQTWQKRLMEATDARTTERTSLVAARAAADRRTVGVLDQLAAVTCSAAASGAAIDSGASGGVRAASLGDLLDPVLSDYRAAVDAAESHAADIRALLRAWPVMP